MHGLKVAEELRKKYAEGYRSTSLDQTFELDQSLNQRVLSVLLKEVAQETNHAYGNKYQRLESTNTITM